MDKAGPRLLILLLLLAPALRADLAGAKAAYARGVEYEKNKNYSAASDEYRNALEEEPAYIYARRQLGNCLYYSGDKKAALREYESYLDLKPDDKETRAFYDHLKAELKETAPPEQPQNPADPQPGLALHDAVYIGLSLGFVGTSSDDMQQFVPGVVINDTYSDLGMLKLGFLSESGFWIEGAYTYGPYRQYPILYSSSSSSFTFKDTYTFSESTFSLEPGFRVPLGHKFTLGAGCAMGLSSQNMTYSSTLYPTQTFTGSSISYSPEMKFGLVFNHIGVDIDLGYHISKSGTMKDNTGAPLIVTNFVTGSASTWNMENSGMFLRLGAVYYFNSPLPPQPKAKRRRHES